MIPHAQRRTYRFVKNYVTKNVLSDSIPISVRALSNSLGVSCIPVREALFRVSHEGLIDFLPEKGFFARKMSLVDVTQSCAIARVVAIIGLDQAYLSEHAEAIDTVRESANSCYHSLSKGVSTGHAFWWIEAVVRRLVHVVYQRQTRWHLLRMLDQTLVFRRAVSQDARAATDLASMLAHLATEMAEGRLDQAITGIETIVEYERVRLCANYSRYNDALLRARRLQNGSAGVIEGILINRARPTPGPRVERHQHH